MIENIKLEAEEIFKEAKSRGIRLKLFGSMVLSLDVLCIPDPTLI